MIPYPPPVYGFSIIGAAFLGALPLAGIIWLAGSEKRSLRLCSYALLAIVAFMTFYWPSIPRDLF